VTLDGGEGNDLLTTVYGNADVVGGPGDDTLVLTDDINSPGRADIRLDDDHVAVYRGGAVAHLISYSGIESLRLDLGPDDTGNDLTVLSSIAGPVTINGSAGNDLVKVIGLQGPLTVNGGGGGIDALVIDRTGDINGLTGELMTNALAGLGFPAAITYTGVEQLTVNLGSGADAFTIQGTSTDTTVNTGQGADQVIVHATGGRTTVNGDEGEDTLSLEIADTGSLPASAFAELSFSVETLRLDHTGNEATEWRVEDGAIWAGMVEVVGTEGSDRIFIAGNGQGDTLDVTDNVPDQQTVAIEGNTVEVQHGATPLTFESSLSDPSGAVSVIESPDGLQLYSVGMTDPDDKAVEFYGRDSATGALSLQGDVQRLWLQDQELIAADGAAHDGFGWSAAISGDTAIIGSAGDDNGRGSAYIFEETSPGIWTQVAKLVASDGVAGDYFGWSVGIAGDTAIVGAYDDDNGRGSAYIFDETSPGVWTQRSKLVASDGAAPDCFGWSVGIAGDTAIIGALYDSDRGESSGSAYIFVETSPGVWTQRQKLLAADTAMHDFFGSSVAISGDTAVVGAPNSNGKAPDSGSAYVFEKTTTGVWTQKAKLTAQDGASFDEFGWHSVAISGDTVIVGAENNGEYRGAAYIFEETRPGVWTQQAKLTAPDGATYDKFGRSVAISGDTVIVGVPWDDSERGSAYMFEETSPGVWTQRQKLTAADGVAGDESGYSVAVSGDTAVFGASFHGGGGSAYIFRDTDVVAGAVSMTASPDGAHLYVARPDADGLTILSRDAATGALSVVEELRDPAHLQGVDLVRVNVDGSLAYAATDNGLSVFSRDPVSGKLTFRESIGTGSLGRVTGFEMSADGRFVYVTGEGNLLRTYSPSNTTLTQCGPDIAISDPAMPALSPDGVNLYVARPADNAITVFTRDVTTGLLTYLQEVRNGVNGVRGLDGVGSLTVTEDYVFAAGEGDDALVAFRRDEDGRLTFAQRLRNRSGGVQGLENPISMVVSPDGRYLYTASRGEGASPGGVAWFGIESSVIAAPPLIVGYSGIGALTVTTAGADDLVSVRGVAIPLTVETGGGADSVSLYGSLTGSTTEVRLGAGDDFLEVRSTGPNATTSIFGEAGEDVIQVWSTGDSATTLIDSGAGEDLIEVAGDGLSAPLTVNGGDPSALPGDALVFSGEADTLSPSTPDGEISAGGSVMVSFSGLEQVRFLTAPPQASGGGPYTLQEGGSLTLNGSGSVIPSGQSLVSVEWDLDGDGGFGDLTGFTPAPLSWADLQSLGLGDDGTYQVAIRVTTDVGSDIDTASVAIVNTPPTLSITGAAAVDEDQPYTLHPCALDPGEDTISGWTIDWGDGMIEEIRSHPPSVTHVYNYREDPYTISASAADEDGAYGPVSTTVLVNDVPPVQVLTGEDSVSEGEIYTLGVNAVSTAGDTIEQWIIDWGDGSAKEILNTRAATLNHVFPDDSAREEGGVFKIKATAIDEDGIYSAIKTVMVANVAPTLTLTGDSHADEGVRYMLGLSSEDPGNDSIVGWSIDWGDGTTDALTGDVHTVAHVYKDGYAKYDISGTATDEDGTYGSPTLSVEVEDVPPDTAVTGAQSVGEGAFYTLSIDPATDPGDDTVTQYIIDWGDGTIETVAPPAALASGFMPRLSASHVYADEDDLTGPISISLVDEDGTHAGVATLAVQVKNMPPVVDAGVEKTVKEGEWVELNGAFTEPGSKDTHSFLWQVLADNGQVVPDGTGQDFSFTPADNGIYTATFTVTDNDGGVGTDAVVIRVANVAPSLEISGEAIAVESEPYTLTLGPVTDPGEDMVTQYTVHWGDGISVQYDTGGEKSHTYSTPGVKQTIRVDLVDEDGTYANVAGMDVLVVSAAPKITSLSLDQTLINENDSVTLTGEFEQLGLAVEHTVVVDWGDGSTSTLELDPPAQPGTESFVVSHQYLDDDPTGTPSDDYTIHVAVEDNDGDTDSGMLTLSVLNVAPEITSLVSSAPEVGDARPGDAVTVCGLFSDVGTLDTHTADIDWGDGTVTSAVVDQTAGSFSATHAYTTGGIFDIRVILSDDDLGSAVGWTTALVTGARIKDGELQVVGTHGNDQVSINEVGKKLYKVQADFLPGRCHYVTFSASDVESLRILLGDGNDHANIAGNIDLPVTIDGGAGNDHLNAGRGPSILIGGEGNDKLIGSRGDDQIYGGGGNDLILGGGGHDLLDGGSGDDRIFGSCGNDVILGGDGNDWIFGDGGNDTLDGGAGYDKVVGGRGNDELSGGEGNDRLYGGSGNDVLDGGPGDDRLYGDRGDDQLFGGDGNDVLVGGPGKDTLDGGGGEDKLIDWTCKPVKPQPCHKVKMQPCSSWVQPFVCDTKTNNPNSGIKIVLSPAKDEGHTTTAGRKR
jgi:Ca2+-binding RTX toxin-like protein/6-phosphogluconolactonase (cycloisomerase 2 family)